MATSKNKSVFEKYAHEYDLITNASQREKYHGKEVGTLIEKFRPSTVLDAGCASGLTTMLFAKAGVRAVGIDRSRQMLKVAKGNYDESGLPLEFRWARFESLPARMNQSFDMVVCLANSISGVETATDLKKSLRSFFHVLRPGAHLVLQMLNYSAIKEAEVMPIRVTENDGIVYARYSIRRGNRLAVHVVRVDLTGKQPQFEPFCHEFGNFTPERVAAAMTSVGFKNLHRYGNLSLSGRFKKSSRDLVLVGQRL